MIGVGVHGLPDREEESLMLSSMLLKERRANCGALRREESMPDHDVVPRLPVEEGPGCKGVGEA